MNALTAQNRALSTIQQILSGTSWDSDTAGAIAEVMRGAGYEVADLSEGEA
ncbi:hypothetical protein D3C71_2116340 [compost metagenome]